MEDGEHEALLLPDWGAILILSALATICVVALYAVSFSEYINFGG